YPDLPKGYQISQFDLPICADGYLEIADPQVPEQTRRIGIIRAHLEEDAGKSMHDEVAGTGDSRIDLNRCGTPLLEIVSQPDLRSAAQAHAYLTKLKGLLTHMDVSDCEMQEGSLRVDANINLHIESEGQKIATPIVEIKNMNSFRAVENALQFEVGRQFAQWEKTGNTIDSEPKTTWGWDEVKEITFLQRAKEDSADYRYFPDPDLLPVRIPIERVDQLRQSLGETPEATRQRLQSQYQIKPYDADVIVSQGRAMIDYFEQAASKLNDGKRASAWLQQDVLRTMNDRQIDLADFPVSADQLGELLGRVDSGELDTSRARDVFNHLLDHTATVAGAITELGIETVDSSEIEALCRELLHDNPKVAEDLRAGKKQAVSALIGQARKKNPNANPKEVRQTILRLIESE
ncbi:MAG: Asp-tRNA(Asn)/Glu-tRNA(Gln) amidotransferase subunit GatB, partial [Pirellulales bacterium]|nr:Asp-tRNA(Asn)/Glu-tRNA(Gln) amidotransferase subunit GatB [Pirellulales bacterium]